MSSFDLDVINSALSDSSGTLTGVDFTGKSLKLDTEKDAQPIVDAINACPNLHYLTLTGNTLGVAAAQAIAKALDSRPELKICRWSDMFTGRMKTEIPPALSALGDGMIKAGARLSVLELSDNAFGPIGVEGLAKLLQSDVCSELQELRLNNNGLGITGGKLLATALSARPRQLKVFIAGRNRLENEGAKALAKVFQQMGTLEEVAMPQNGIYHVGISALSEAFKHNPRLSCVNLNDNTIGPRGAAAFADALPRLMMVTINPRLCCVNLNNTIGPKNSTSFADALPRLKNLKSINFGDCLLKSKGAKALAKGLRDNSVLIESLDLGHNEIGREACMEVVDSITLLPDSGDRLSRVVLAGNSLGGASNMKLMKQKLGACAELSDGEGSDDEYVTDSEEEEEEEEEEDGTQSDRSEDSATEDARHDTLTDTKIQDIVLDTSGVEEVETEVGRFLQDPTIDNLIRLGPNAADIIDVHLQSIKDPTDLIQAYVEATFLVSGLSAHPSASSVARDMYQRLCARAGQQHAAAWLLANTMLRGLGLIKSENKEYKIRWHIPSCYSVLGAVIDAQYFPAALRDTLRFFITSKLPSLPSDARDTIQACQALYST